jgi:hypothetical protein
LEDVGGLSAIEIDRTAGKITLKGGGIDLQKAVDALNAGGFYASLQADEEKKSDK